MPPAGVDGARSEGTRRRPLERSAGSSRRTPGFIARRRAPAQAVGRQGLEGPRPETAARGPEALDLEAEAREGGDATAEDLVLVLGRQRVPDLVAPAVQPDLVAGRRDVEEGLGIELGVQALHEEGRAQVERGEGLERARQPDGHGGVVADRALRGAALEVRGLAEVVEAEQDRVAQVAAHAGSPFATITGVDSRRSTWPRTAPCSSSTHPRPRA